MSSILLGESWKYLLVPVWVLTYRGKNDKIYYYAMNGQTTENQRGTPCSDKKEGSQTVFGRAL